MRERPIVQLDTPWGVVKVALHSDSHVQMTADSLVLNKTLHRLDVELRRGSAGWWSTGRFLGVTRLGGGRPSSSARRVEDDLVKLFEHWASRNPDKMAEARTAYLEGELARWSESVEYALKHLNEAEGTRNEILVALGREPLPLTTVVE